MQNQRAFNFGRTHAMARYVDDIVDAAGDPVISVLVAAAAVAREVLALVSAEIGLDEAFVIAVDRPRLTGPASGDAQIALCRTVQNMAFIVDQLRAHTEERPSRAARFHVVRAGQGGDHAATGFGLPPGVYDRQFPPADSLVIPAPRLGIDRLAHAAQQTER